MEIINEEPTEDNYKIETKKTRKYNEKQVQHSETLPGYERKISKFKT